MSRARQRSYTLDIDPTCDIGCSLALWLRLHSASFPYRRGRATRPAEPGGNPPGESPRRGGAAPRTPARQRTARRGEPPRWRHERCA